MVDCLTIGRASVQFLVQYLRYLRVIKIWTLHFVDVQGQTPPETRPPNRENYPISAADCLRLLFFLLFGTL
jgi:hypothetical protein